MKDISELANSELHSSAIPKTITEINFLKNGKHIEQVASCTAMDWHQDEKDVMDAFHEEQLF